jgi:hypothetical protein
MVAAGIDTFPTNEALVSVGLIVAIEAEAVARLRPIVEAAEAWAKAYGDRWDGMQGKIEPPDPRIEADATRALYTAVLRGEVE